MIDRNLLSLGEALRNEEPDFTGEFTRLMELRSALRVCEIGNARLQILPITDLISSQTGRLP
jgi:hypothetical protein